MEAKRYKGWIAFFDGDKEEERGWFAADDLSGLTQAMGKVTTKEPDRVVRFEFDDPDSEEAGGASRGGSADAPGGHAKEDAKEKGSD